MSLMAIFGLIMGYFNESGISIQDYFVVLIFPLIISIALLTLLLAKKGVLIIDDKIYRAQYIFGYLLLKKRIDFSDITDISILRYDGQVKYNFFSAAKPDLDYQVEINKIYLLNEKHTIKRLLISTLNNDLAEKGVEKIKSHFKLRYKLYNPRFYD